MKTIMLTAQEVQTLETFGTDTETLEYSVHCSERLLDLTKEEREEAVNYYYKSLEEIELSF